MSEWYQQVVSKVDMPNLVTYLNELHVVRCDYKNGYQKEGG